MTSQGAVADILPAAPSRPRVLVAEDEPQLLRIVTRMLTASGFEVVQAHDGLQAAQQLKENSFDAVLTDVSMPEMTGLELLRSARMYDLEVPILLMTGAPDVASAVEAVRHGAC